MITPKYRKNTLLKALKVQQITWENTQRGITQQWVFDNLIKDEFFICQSTFYKYLGLNAKKLLKQLK